jgi:hypothetical protein
MLCNILYSTLHAIPNKWPIFVPRARPFDLRLTKALPETTMDHYRQGKQVLDIHLLKVELQPALPLKLPQLEGWVIIHNILYNSARRRVLHHTLPLYNML